MIQRFAVLQNALLWQVIDPDGVLSEHPSREEALARAEALARRARWSGQAADVLVQRGHELSRHMGFSAPAQELAE